MPGTALWKWPETFFQKYLSVLVEMGLLSEMEKETFERKWDERSRDPGAFFCTPPMIEVIGFKK